MFSGQVDVKSDVKALVEIDVETACEAVWLLSMSEVNVVRLN